VSKNVSKSRSTYHPGIPLLVVYVGLLRAPSQPKAVTAVRACRFKHWLQDLYQCLLYHLVYHRWYSTKPRSPVRLGYLYPPDRVRFVPPPSMLSLSSR
jgi:hypothetical protein